MPRPSDRALNNCFASHNGNTRYCVTRPRDHQRPTCIYAKCTLGRQSTRDPACIKATAARPDLTSSATPECPNLHSLVAAPPSCGIAFPLTSRRDFVPWRFSAAGRRSVWRDHRCRRLKTCTKLESTLSAIMSALASCGHSAVPQPDSCTAAYGDPIRSLHWRVQASCRET